ncbi:MAG TPA: non-canonical purine NTP diphosphatase [Bacteroidales bacterium]|nr:non-canonical purine NTP diphosphatase [Bacteroidales bacterium]
MHKIVFATNNAHKMGEVSAILDSKFKLIGLKEIGCYDEIPETSDTIEGNALQKANYVWEHYGIDCIADDTGLEVEALNGAPGVYSARYAGEECIAENNIQKLLKELDGVQNRKARFKTVAALILNGRVNLFEGVIYGRILTEKRGQDGFGYDPVFVPDHFNESFAEMTSEQKNSISHRALAFKAFAEFMNR